MKAALLTDRGILRVSGDPARHFLHNLVTANIETLTPGHARYAALLTPQGKIIVDFFVVEAPVEDGGGFFIDAPKVLVPDLAQKLNFYKLRTKVTIETLDALSVLAVWDGIGSTEYGLDYRDPRLPALGQRVLIPAEVARDAARDLGAELVDAAEYEAHRITLGVPRGGVDFIYGDVFPHDADLDKLNGVDFKKGCFIGQEVVSRVEHRGTARNRIVPVEFDAHAAEDGSPVMAGDKHVGTMGSSAGKIGLAMLRVDRVADALAAGVPLIAGGIPMRLREGAVADFLKDAKG
ncbi:MAG: YgfZ/GcvT domain-containing protein [Pseudomonadota bacterium]